MLKVSTTLALLAIAVVFSKLDAHSGFWQIALTNKFRLLTTLLLYMDIFVFYNIHLASQMFQ